MRAARRNRDETGSVSVWLATASFVMVIIVGLAVDLAGQVQAQQRARDVAAQAARAGGQQIIAATAIQGDGAVVDPASAQAAAQRYLASAGIQGRASIEGPDRLTVTTRTRYQTKFLSIIGMGSLPASGEASAHLVRAVEGTEQ
jgi:Flp pilus assembly protein TadG